MNILFCGGGTGGHIYPGLALARYIVKVNKDAKILFVGTSRGLENKIIPEAGFDLEVMPVRALSNSRFKEKPAAVADLFRSLGQAFRIINKFKPRVVVGTGGYAAGPMALAARMKNIPVLLHEQNAIPGKTNRLIAPWANKVCITFKDSEKYFRSKKVLLTGNPRAGEVIQLTATEGNARLGLTDFSGKTILAFGGSQGALRINSAIVDLIKNKLLPAESRLIFVTGKIYFERVMTELAGVDLSRITIKPYLDDMPSALAVSDIVICRAGATALAELTACGLPAVLIPSPNVAYNHQYYNARILEKVDAAKIILEEDLTAENLIQAVAGIINNPKTLKIMSDNSKSLGITDAAERMYDCILKEVI